MNHAETLKLKAVRADVNLLIIMLSKYYGKPIGTYMKRGKQPIEDYFKDIENDIEALKVLRLELEIRQNYIKDMEAQ